MGVLGDEVVDLLLPGRVILVLAFHEAGSGCRTCPTILGHPINVVEATVITLK
jgi:hypothetical protein